MLFLCIASTVILLFASLFNFAILVSEDDDYIIQMVLVHLGPVALALVTIWVLYSKL